MFNKGIDLGVREGLEFCDRFVPVPMRRVWLSPPVATGKICRCDPSVRHRALELRRGCHAGAGVRESSISTRRALSNSFERVPTTDRSKLDSGDGDVQPSGHVGFDRFDRHVR